MPLLHDVAHLGHAELLTPEPDKSLWFFTQVLGLTENGTSGDSVYLRTWDDYEHHSLKLTASHTSGLGRTGLRASSEDALHRRVAQIEQAGLGIGWQSGDAGIGPTYLFRDPDGHEFELYWESDWYQPEGELKPALKNQAQANPGRGVPVRRLDHVNFLAAQTKPNGDFVSGALGGRVTEQIVLDDGTISAQWLHFAQKSYDLVYTNDWTGTNGRLHHIAFATDTREDVLRAADLCLDRDVFIETGPHKHAIQQTFFLYVYEPGGNRIELCNPCARLIFAPDWAPISWSEAERAKGQAWGLATIPLVPHPRDPAGAVMEETHDVPADARRTVAGALRAAILRGEFVPRQRLVEADLCERFGATRFIVRAVLQDLSAQGLVEFQRNRGARVREISLAEAIEITEVRKVLEGLEAARAAERITAAEAAVLQSIVADMHAAVSRAELLRYSELNARLHATVRDIAAHETSARLLRQLRDQTVRHQFSLSLVPGRPAVSLPQHEAIVAAVTARDPAAAERAMHDHLQSVIEALQALPVAALR